MRAGALRHAIVISVATANRQNSFGEDAVSQTTLGTFPCSIEYLSGRELEQASQRWAEARYKITMRRQPGIAFHAGTFGAPSTKSKATWLNGPGGISRDLDIVDVQDPGENNPVITMYARDYQG